MKEISKETNDFRKKPPKKLKSNKTVNNKVESGFFYEIYAGLFDMKFINIILSVFVVVVVPEKNVLYFLPKPDLLYISVIVIS